MCKPLFAEYLPNDQGHSHIEQLKLQIEEKRPIAAVEAANC
jgi:hypothetical protein